jgi:predicted RNA-binding Zn-ribbon protein involved in translation (DUF1610 family)
MVGQSTAGSRRAALRQKRPKHLLSFISYWRERGVLFGDRTTCGKFGGDEVRNTINAHAAESDTPNDRTQRTNSADSCFRRVWIAPLRRLLRSRPRCADSPAEVWRRLPKMAGTMGSKGQIAMNTANKCANCGSDLPETRTRYCSRGCLVLWKRERARLAYGHRHKYQCSDCGHVLRLGRRRK